MVSEVVAEVGAGGDSVESVDERGGKTMKFAVGDKVRVIGDTLGKYGYYVGKVGVIDDVSETLAFPYLVEFEDDHPLDFAAEELELVETMPPCHIIVSVVLPAHESYEIVVDAGPGWAERVYDELKRLETEEGE